MEKTYLVIIFMTGVVSSLGEGKEGRGNGHACRSSAFWAVGVMPRKCNGSTEEIARSCGFGVLLLRLKSWSCPP